MARRERKNAAYLATLLEVKAANYDDGCPDPRIIILKKFERKTYPNFREVKLVVAGADGKHISIGHDKISLQHVQASSSAVNRAIKRRASEYPIHVVLLPGTDIMTYHKIFDKTTRSFKSGYIESLVMIADNCYPLCGYSRMAQAADDLYMPYYSDNLNKRIDGMLYNGELFRVEMRDVKATLDRFPESNFYRRKVIDALGRAAAARTILSRNFRSFRELQESNVQYSEDIQAAKSLWLMEDTEVTEQEVTNVTEQKKPDDGSDGKSVIGKDIDAT